MMRSFVGLLAVSSLMSLTSAVTAILKSSDWATGMLDHHNDARRLVKAGQAEYNGAEGRQVQPPAVTMPDLSWSDSLAQDAADFAATCPFPLHLLHVDPTNVQAYTQGENIAWSSSSNPTKDMMEGFVRDGFIGSERPFYRYSLGKSLCDEGKIPGTNTDITCGHYVQIIRAAATQVGCAYQVCGSGTYNGGGVQMVCRYDSPNWSDQYPYTAGATTTAASGGGNDPSCLSVSNMLYSRYTGTFTPTGLQHDGHNMYDNQDTGYFLWYDDGMWVMSNKLYSLSASRFGSCTQAGILDCTGKWSTSRSTLGTFTTCGALNSDTPECYLEAPTGVELFDHGLIAEDDESSEAHKLFSRDEAVGCYNDEPVFSYVALVGGAEVSFYLHHERLGTVDVKWVLSVEQISTFSSPFCTNADLAACVSGQWQTLDTGNATDADSVASVRSMQAEVVYGTGNTQYYTAAEEAKNNTAIVVAVVLVVVFLAIIMMTVAYKVHQKKRIQVGFQDEEEDQTDQADLEETGNAGETVAMTTR